MAKKMTKDQKRSQKATKRATKDERKGFNPIRDERPMTQKELEEFKRDNPGKPVLMF